MLPLLHRSAAQLFSVVAFVALLSPGFLTAGIPALPLIVAEQDSDWEGQSLDEDLEQGIVLEALFLRESDGARVFAFSAPPRTGPGDQLRAFAQGIRSSIAESGIRNLGEANKSIGEFTGITLSFGFRNEDGSQEATVFVFEHGGRFYAYVAVADRAPAGVLDSLVKAP